MNDGKRFASDAELLDIPALVVGEKAVARVLVSPSLCFSGRLQPTRDRLGGVSLLRCIVAGAVVEKRLYVRFS